jgi:hypothetical protein
MKKKIGLLVLLLSLLSACGTPVGTEPTEQVRRTPTSITISIPTSLLKPTSTPDERIKDAYVEGRPSCQVSPNTVHPGSSVNVSAFNMPADHLVLVHVFSQLATTDMTDNNGYVNIDIVIPANALMGLHLVSILAEGMEVAANCVVRIWTEPIPTPTLSQEQIAATATQQTLQERLGKYCRLGSALRAKLSPNGQWFEVNCEPDVIKIIYIDESKIWDISSNRLIGLYSDHFVHVFHWSNDGTYVYVFINPHTDGYWESFHQGIVLYRLTLETGQISEVLPLGKSDWIFYSFAFSPNDRRLAYIMTDQSPVILNLRDMQSGDEQSFEFGPKYNTGGRFVWSPNSQKLVFSIRQFDTSIYEHIATSIVLWEKEKSDTTIMIKDHEENLVPIEWVNDTKIMLQVQYEDETKFEFDLISGELKQISP